MADKKITQLPSASVATANNVLPIVQSGVTDQITVTNLGTGILNLGLAVTASTVTANSNGAGTNFKVGDDTWIGDVNLANTMQVQGQQDATKAFVKFGSGSNSPIVGGVAGSDLFQITGSVNVTGSITANGFTGPLTGTASVAISSSMAQGVSSSISTQNVAHNVLFQEVTAGATKVEVDGGLRYNPNTNILTTTASFALTASSVNSLTQNVLVTGSVNISSALNLAPTNPLPTGVVGSLAVSGSNLYFHNGADWIYVI